MTISAGLTDPLTPTSYYDDVAQRPLEHHTMIAGLMLLAQLHCAPNASGSVDCFDAQKGGAPVLKVEKNVFGGFDLRQSDGKLVRCEKKAGGETECRVVQEGQTK